MKIFLDDCRMEPQGWTRMLHAASVIAMLEECAGNGLNVEELSLDNDLGLDEPEGKTVLDWLEERRHFEPSFPLPGRILVHSANPVARQRMNAVIERLYHK
jgi:hypothetical protein